ncbi:HAMP domain-containing methyl-accepting chemotaxis protein [Paenibacillus sp. MER TA 81-3]|uniref:methyl-accepting chemotaxis protein n=1 Tax=Paenibacillus sp. MER TA 81-3 TaxID=2939573 RepID=UPI002040E384|nr:HAMP domain-containing methyl-accepting chemotaxis protein [Paenibacillus sp. MER TA 81-3]MCM3341451.1 HAMP domain-containing methyl-accepting chemotaxis protein [Paenibacillus sp. MER TA 81-3]
MKPQSINERIRTLWSRCFQSLLARILLPICLLTLLVIQATCWVNISYMKNIINDLMVEDTQTVVRQIGKLVVEHNGENPKAVLNTVAFKDHSYALLVKDGKVVARAGMGLSKEEDDLSPLYSGEQHEMHLETGLGGYAFAAKAGEYIVISVSDFDDFDNGLDSYNWIMYGVSVGALVVIAGVTWLLVRRLFVTPIQSVSYTIEHIGEGDFTDHVALDTSRKDIWGAVARSFSDMRTNLKSLVDHVVDTSEKITLTSNEFAISSQETSKSSEQITISLQDISMGVDEGSKKLAEVSQMIEDVTMAIGEVDQVVKTITNEFAKANDKVVLGNDIVNQTVGQMNQLSENVESSSKIMHNLEQKSGKIGEIIKIITDIAGQTNLLALNAAIEAARAGEHGRGFAVVANEVRVLADQSNKAAMEIHEIISEVQSETVKAVEVMDKGNQFVKSGIGSVNETGDVFHAMVTMMQEISNLASMVEAIVQEVNTSSQEMLEQVQGVAQISEESAASVQSIAAATEEQNAVMEELASSAEEFKRMSHGLQEALGKFKF